MSEKNLVELYTDGACSGNPGPGGYGAILKFNNIEKEISGGEELTTNNRMELTAVIEWHFSETRVKAIEELEFNREAKRKIDDGFWKGRPSLLQALREPEMSEEVKELYYFILDVQAYTLNRGVGMGVDVAIAADMSKILPIAKEHGIDIYTYKDYLNKFIAMQSKLENKGG